MLRSLVFLLGTLVSVIDAVDFSPLPPSVVINLGDNASFTVNVTNIEEEDILTWIVQEVQVANLSLEDGNLAMNNGTNTGFAYEVSAIGNDTTLSLISPDLNMNGSMIKITDQSKASDVSMLLIKVRCGTPEDGITMSCMDPDCDATGTVNETENGKFRLCNSNYTCRTNGTWNRDNEKCTEPICVDVGKWGENCTEDCGDGCPFTICVANGSCADESYLITAACKEGFSGSKCDQQVTASSESGTTSVTSTATSSEESSTSPTTASSSTPVSTESSTVTTTGCGKPLNGSCTKTGQSIKKQVQCERIIGKVETCTEVWTCEGGMWQNTSITCTYKCRGGQTWGPKCQSACGEGCRDENLTLRCDSETGRCLDLKTGKQKEKGVCRTGYTGDNCDKPICDQDCNGGVCLSENFCGNCPRHHEHGRTCRNIRLDGFLKGSLPSLAILAFVVTLLTISSKLYIRSKIKEA